MIGVYKKHWVYWLRLHIHLRFIVISGVWNYYPLFMQKHYFDTAPVSIYRYFEDEPNSGELLRLDW